MSSSYTGVRAAIDSNPTHDRIGSIRTYLEENGKSDLIDIIVRLINSRVVASKMEEKRAIVIGASSGIGQAVAKKLSDEGYRIGIAARREQRLAALKNELSTDVWTCELDVTEPQVARRKCRDLIENVGGVDLAILSAGVFQENPELQWEAQQKTVNVNVLGFTAVANLFFEHFRDRNRGHLVGISSIGALHGGQTAPSYNASKAFVSTFLQGIQRKARVEGLDIAVTDVKPGFVDTEISLPDDAFWVASPDEAAEQIYAAIAEEKSHIYVTKRWRLIGLLLKLIPEPAQQRLSQYAN